MIMNFDELGLYTKPSGDSVLHILWGTSSVPWGIFQRDLKTGIWFFSGTGWSKYSSEWLKGIADELDKMNAETLQKM
jgi:hypothetical protein